LVRVRVLVEGLLDVAEERLRMMQPPRHIRAMPPMFSFHLFLARSAQQHVALRVADDLRAVERAADVLDELSGASPENLALTGPFENGGGATRSSLSAERQRAKTLRR
jgi:hypothetical protein